MIPSVSRITKYYQNSIPEVIRMHSEKVSISIPPSLYGFIESYRAAHHLKSRSQVISEALELLRQRELEVAYRAASEETDNGFDIALSDGLSDETW